MIVARIVRTAIQMDAIDAVLVIEVVALKGKMTQGVHLRFLYNLVQVYSPRFSVILDQ